MFKYLLLVFLIIYLFELKHKPIQYYKGNTLKQLRAFCSVARTGKMTHAADEMFLSQSAISLQIKALEDTFRAPRPANPADARRQKAARNGQADG